MQDTPQGGQEEPKTSNPTVPPQRIPDENPANEKAPDPNQEIARWTKVVGNWTRGLVFIGIGTLAIFYLQWSSFVESERAFLILKDVSFAYGDPINMESRRDFTVVFRNVGKHISKVGKMEAAPIYGVIKKNLPEILAEHKSLNTKYVIPPIAPDSEVTALAEAHRVKPPVGDSAFIKGLLDGTIPLWFYGFVEYETGYPSLRSGKLGFCMKYIPPAERRPGMSQFRTCEYPEYTYAR